MTVVGCHPYEFGWLAERAGCELTPGFKAIKAVDAQGRIHGMVGYSGWTANMVIMHIALEHPAAFRSLLEWAFKYPFEQAGRSVALATVRESNLRSMALCSKVGFKELCRVRDGIEPGEDMVLFEMRREDCRWLSQRKAA